jgi:cell wall-associated NlpC family hydrolase
MAVTGSQIVSEVEKFAGDAYVYGATGPSSFDCSGLVQHVLSELGVSGVPRTSEAQWAWVQKIPASQLQPGDLVFAQFPGDNQSPGHVGVYVGGGKVLSAEDPAQGVGYATLSSWTGNIVGYGKVPGASTTGTAASSSGGVSLWPGQVTGFFTDLDKALGGVWGALAAFLSPGPWIRAGAALAGALCLLAGLWFLVKASL